MKTIEQLRSSVDVFQSEVRAIGIQLARAKKDVTAIETEMVGAKEALRLVQEQLDRAEAKVIRDEVSSREVEIARMKGFRLEFGERLTKEIQLRLR